MASSAASASASDAPVQHHDLLIIGAGLSGINTAYLLRKDMPHRTFTILEARDVVGGTWNFFKYPGFRSDSSMSTFGLYWHTWPHPDRVGKGPDIAAYIADAVDKHDLARHIRLGHRVVEYDWRDEEQRWTIRVKHEGIVTPMTANFVVNCTGYYSYDQTFKVDIPGLDRFAGKVAHTQWWPEDYDYKDKRVVVVGSGATAVTIVPALAAHAAQVTMVQRSPSYVLSIENLPALDRALQKVLPLAWYGSVSWWMGIVMDTVASQAILRYPDFFKKILRWATRKELKGSDVDVDTHFSPRYRPFEQRLCMCPEGDFFKALKRKNCEIVTDVIDTVVEDGLVLASGRKIEADMIVTATGLYFELIGGIRPTVNGRLLEPGELYTWRGCMLETLPNMAFVMGYVTQTWTPGADVMARMVMRVLRAMEERGAASVVPTLERWEGMPEKLAVETQSNYFIKAAGRMPKTTGKGPWYGREHYVKDVKELYFADMGEGLVYTGESKKDS